MILVISSTATSASHISPRIDRAVATLVFSRLEEHSPELAAERVHARDI